jgi:hypothetical protein
MRRNGQSVTPDIGARITLWSSVSDPICMKDPNMLKN